ncbi:MAG TPA: nucleoside-diphosphate sugar epimerase/dehydratase [Bryobacteraceae bacterium]|nr:nucleoside-diphosphate sugar epimerase/dehydratase [Bryobacteraceae bacterium]
MRRGGRARVKPLILKHRRPASEAMHMGLASLALVSAFLLRFEFTLEPMYLRMLIRSLPLLVAMKFLVFRAFGLRDLSWRFLGFDDLARISLANVVGSAATTVILRVAIGPRFPRSVYVLDLLVCLILMTAARGFIRSRFEARRVGGEARRILIYGAGKAGITVLSEIRANRRLGYVVAGFLDDDPQKRDLRLDGVRVLGGREVLEQVARKYRAEEVLIALPNAAGAEITAAVERCRRAGVAAKRIPALAELIEHKVLIDQIRDVRLEDLLGRPPVRLEHGMIRAKLAGRVVLVTGAGGSIGSELCRQIGRFSPRALVGLDSAETALYQIEQELKERFPELAFYPEIGSIQNRHRLDELFRDHRPAAVYHAAAYKHVPMMEAHLFEAVENNVFGTRSVARAASAWGVEDFLLISSDKAVRATNVMGATKRLAELICLAADQRSVTTRFHAVRFGNVLGSNGSVIPLFQRQIAAGGPVTVTHPDIRRYFMTIPEAAELVLQASAMGQGGEIFVLDMGEPVRIQDLARNLILLSGLRPDVDVRIEFTGLRPGEKLYEELSSLEENTVPTRHAKIRIFAGNGTPENLSGWLEELRRSTEAREAAGALLCLKELVPDYNPSSFLLRKAFKEQARGVVA